MTIISMTNTEPTQKADIDDKVIVSVWTNGLKRIGSVVEVTTQEVDGKVEFYYLVRIWGGRDAMTDAMKIGSKGDQCWFNDNEIELSDAYLHRIKRRA